MIIPNGSKVHYTGLRSGTGIVRFHECPEGDHADGTDLHRYLVHFSTGANAGQSKQVWLRSNEVTELRRTPADPALFARTAPQWNCVDYPDGPHYTPGDRCLWCGKSREQIEAEYEARISH